MTDCVFCRIAAGTLAAHLVHDAYFDDAARVLQPSSARRSNLMPPTIPV